MTTRSQILSTEIDGQHVLHSFISQEAPTNRLLIMLPGRAYLTVHPLMHYLRQIAVSLGFDVLSVTYAFHSQLYSTEGMGGDLLGEIRQAANQVFDERHYGSIVVAGKSMGTLLASLYGGELAVRFPQSEISYLMLTPIQRATQAVDQRRTLAIIGTADDAYDAALVEDDSTHAWIDWQVFEDLNHSLEHHEDWQLSLRRLDEILMLCQEFLKRC